MDYFENPLLPGKPMFRCERIRGTLTVQSCAQMWRKEHEDGEGVHHACRLCPTGSVHAGEVAASLSPLKGTLTCSRCHRKAPRLICGMHCPSCYNRSREALRGWNAKGTKPVKIGQLSCRRIRCLVGDEVRVMAHRHTVDTDEMIVAALRDSKRRVVFAWNSAPPPAVRQARLW